MAIAMTMTMTMRVAMVTAMMAAMVIKMARIGRRSRETMLGSGYRRRRRRYAMGKSDTRSGVRKMGSQGAWWLPAHTGAGTGVGARVRLNGVGAWARQGVRMGARGPPSGRERACVASARSTRRRSTWKRRAVWRVVA